MREQIFLTPLQCTGSQNVCWEKHCRESATRQWWQQKYGLRHAVRVRHRSIVRYSISVDSLTSIKFITSSTGLNIWGCWNSYETDDRCMPSARRILAVPLLVSYAT